MLTLEQFEIPDYNRQGWKMLDSLERLNEYLKIKDIKLNSESNNPLPVWLVRIIAKIRDSGIKNAIFKEDTTYKNMQDWKIPLSFKEIFSVLNDEQITKLCDFITLGQIPNPYFTNNFPLWVKAILEWQDEASNTRIITDVDEFRKLVKVLLDKHPIQIWEYKDPWDWSGDENFYPDKLTYPYFITLKRKKIIVF